MRFLGLGLKDRVPAETVSLYHEGLAQAGMVEMLFQQFGGYLTRRGYVSHVGQILDASIVVVSRNRYTRGEKKAIKAGKMPVDWTDEPAKLSQKDTDACWSEEDQKTVPRTVFPTSKHGESHYGYKNQLNVELRHKLVRRYHIGDATLHDRQAMDYLLSRSNTGSGVWTDAAYRFEEIEAKIRAMKLRSHIHRKGKRRKSLTKQADSNQHKTSIHVTLAYFGAQDKDMSGTLVRKKSDFGMDNLAYNTRRLGRLRRLNPYLA